METKSLLNIFNEYSNSVAVVQKRKTDIALRIKLLRVENKLTHQDVSKATNIKPLTYSGYENAHNNIPIESLVRLAIFYNVSLDYLCCRTDNKKGCYLSEENSEGDKQKKAYDELISKANKLNAETK